MDAAIVQQMQAEEADLIKKLEAVRAFLIAYGAAPKPVAVADRPVATKAAQTLPTAKSTHSRDRVPLERFTEYGAGVVRAAIESVRNEPSRPVMTRRLVELIEARGVEVRGVDKVNALSALLARSMDLKSIGRRGWTLDADNNDQEEHGDGLSPEENEPSSDEVADGSDADELDDEARGLV